MKHCMKKFYSQIIANTKTDKKRKDKKKIQKIELIKKYKIQHRDMETNSNVTYVNKLITLPEDCLHQNVPIMVMLMTHM